MAHFIKSDQEPWFDAERGVLDRRVFSDLEIYEREVSRIFGRAWNFVAHESQVPTPGSYFMSYLGPDEVIVVRDRQNAVQVLLNSCPHRGNTVCRAEQGQTKSFFCSYHGWNFDLDGQLIGMPGEEAFYGDVDKAEWGLSRAAQVASYRGFVFATMDAHAPPLEDYLGWVGRLGIDMHASKGELEVQDGIHKNRLQCNWKLAVDNLYDWYHVKVSHGASMRLGVLSEASISDASQMVILGEYGHGIGGPGLSEAQMEDLAHRLATGTGSEQWYDQQAAWRLRPEVREALGPVGSRSLGHPNIFPNLWIALTNQICLRIPRGPHETEIWWFTLLPKELNREQRRQAIWGANHFFGPAGLLEQDDGENWSHSTRGAKGALTQGLPVNYMMGKGRAEARAGGAGQSSIETVINEHGQRWTYENWQAWMQAESWQELKASRPEPPEGAV